MLFLQIISIVVNRKIGNILLFLLLLNLTAWGQDKFVLKGKVVDMITVQALENACIHNMSTGAMAFSGHEGDYAMMVHLHDTIVITRVGYEMAVFTIDKNIQSIRTNCYLRLYMKAVMLKQVVVYAMKPYPLFIKDLSKPSDKEKIDVEGVQLSSEDKARYAQTNTNGNLLKYTPLAHPISMLYEKFSRKAKLNRTYYELSDNQDEALRLSEKYNAKIVQRITGLKDVEVDDFMFYCSFSYYTLATATEVDIEQMILRKFYEYKNLPK